MEFMQAVRERKSYRGPFLDTPIPREDLKEIVEAGFLAPSGCNMQTTRFAAVDDPELVKGLADIYGFEWAMTAPAAILILTKPLQSKNGVFYHVEDFAAAAENILLAVTAKGYATTWIEGQIDVKDKARKMAELLGAPEDYKAVIYLPIGVPAQEVKQPKKQAFEERAWFNRYHGQE